MQNKSVIYDEVYIFKNFLNTTVENHQLSRPCAALDVALSWQ